MQNWMKIIFRYGFRIILISLFLGAVPSPAYAYIDPGAGSLFLQILLGGIAGGLLLLKTYWRRLVGKREPDKPDDAPSDEKNKLSNE